MTRKPSVFNKLRVVDIVAKLEPLWGVASHDQREAAMRAASGWDERYRTHTHIIQQMRKAKVFDPDGLITYATERHTEGDGIIYLLTVYYFMHCPRPMRAMAMAVLGNNATPFHNSEWSPAEKHAMIDAVRAGDAVKAIERVKALRKQRRKLESQTFVRKRQGKKP